jgi:hypothetical protein
MLGIRKPFDDGIARRRAFVTLVCKFYRESTMPGTHRPMLDSFHPAMILLAPLLCLVHGCSTYKTQPLDEIPLQQNAQTQQQQNLQVSISVLSDADAAALFGIDLGERWIQALWVKVENRSDDPYWLLASAIDPNVYAPDEVAYSARFFMSPTANEQMVQHFRALSFHNPIVPGSSRSGFVFIPRDEDYKEVNTVLVGPQGRIELDFFLYLQGLKSHSIYDIHKQHANEERADTSTEQLRRNLHELPCCTTGKHGEKIGDPINLVLVGNPEDILPAFVRRGWHPAEQTYAGSIWKTTGSFLFGRQYRYSPISPMYLFDRTQDIGQQKARGSIHQRNHLRLWLSPWRWQGKDVWVGAISRDIGVRFTAQTPYLVTHKIDPDIDEARNSFMESMLLSGRLAQAGYVIGAGQASPEQPGHNLTGDPYFHDGLRAVMVFDRDAKPSDEFKFLGWAATEGTARHLRGPAQTKQPPQPAP